LSSNEINIYIVKDLLFLCWKNKRVRTTYVLNVAPGVVSLIGRVVAKCANHFVRGRTVFVHFFVRCRNIQIR